MGIDLTKSPLEETNREEPPKLELNPEQEIYMGNLRRRLTRAKDRRDTTHDFFDGMSYIQRCEQNRKIANSWIRPKQNKQDTAFTTGTARDKLQALLSAINNMNLKVDITAFDEENAILSDLGEGMEDIIDKTEEIDLDEEKRLWRQFTLVTQGEVFVEEIWSKEWWTNKSIPQFTGKFKGVEWTSSLKKRFERPVRNIIKNEKVYLGDMSQPDIKKQPFIFTLESIPYQKAKSIFGQWENWKFVADDLRHFDANTQDHDTTMYNPHWTISSNKKGFVEVLKYQDKINNEFQIVLNGIPMLPIGFPLPWKHGEYNITMQILELMDPLFAYGKGFIQRIKTISKIEDEIWRLAILKNQQSYAPPMANRTGRILNSQWATPGKIHYGIDPEKFKPMMDAAGNTQSEFNIMKLIRDNFDQHSVNPTFQGQSPSREATATEILELQKQSQMMLAITVFACAMLEKKLAELRVFTLLDKWFDPIDKTIENIRKGFRSVNVEKILEGQGRGQEIVEIAPNEEAIPSPFEQLKEEVSISKRTGIPTKKLILNRKQILNSKLSWRYVVNPTPKKTTNLQKLMFKEELQSFSFSPNLNLDWAEKKAAETWGENPAKVFRKGNPVLPPEEDKRGNLGEQPSRITRKQTPSSTPARLNAS